MNIDEVGEYLEHEGLDDEEIDSVLAHFGVPGQKWGVRRAKKQAKARGKTARKQEVFEAVRRDAKTQRRVATGAAILAGGIIAKRIAKKAKLPASTIYSPKYAAAVLAGAAVVNSAMRVHGAKRLQEL